MNEVPRPTQLSDLARQLRLVMQVGPETPLHLLELLTAEDSWRPIHRSVVTESDVVQALAELESAGQATGREMECPDPTLQRHGNVPEWEQGRRHATWWELTRDGYRDGWVEFKELGGVDAVWGGNHEAVERMDRRYGLV